MSGRTSAAATGMVILLGCWQLFLLPLNHDAAWHLYAAKAILDGQSLYSDLLEFNPPLIYGLSLLPVLAERLSGISHIAVFKAAVLLFVLASAALSARLLRVCFPSLQPGERQLLILAFVYLSLIRVAGDYGQREHFFWLSAFPYILLVLARRNDAKVPALLVGLVAAAAALGFALKPQFLLLFAALEVYLLTERRAASVWRRPEAWAVIAGAAIHITAVVVLFPAYFDVAARAAESYALLERSPMRVFKGLLGLALAAPLALLLLRTREKCRPALKVGFVAYLAVFLLAVLPLKGWTYHLYPLKTVSGILALGVLLAFQGWRWGGRSSSLALRFAPLAGVVIVTLSLGETIQALNFHRNVWENTPTAQVIQVVEDYSPKRALWLLDTAILPAFPAVNYTGSRWASSFPFLWPLAGIYPDAKGSRFTPHSPAERPDMERFLLERVSADLEKFQPDLVLVKTVDIVGFEESSFDLVRYLTGSPRFADLWRSYQLEGVVDSYRIYRLVE